MCCYGQLVTSLMQLDLSVSLFSICSVQFTPFSHVHLFAEPWTAACQASLSITNPGAYPSSCPSTWWCYSTISSCLPLLFLPSIFPNIRVFPMSQLFPSSGQIIGASASPSILPMNIQDWFYLEWIGLISSRSKGLWRVFCNTIV